MKPRVLLVEGKRTDHPSFAAGLTKKGYLVESVLSGSAAVERLEHIIPDLVIDSNADPNDQYGADAVLVLPFTMQKLLNRVKHLLPVLNNGGLHAGPFTLDVEQRRVILEEKQIQLTPRLGAIFKILMEHPGEVINRETLFKEAWETDYTGDTRSLDVHMSWLRQMLEENPRHPRFIKTVRGLGYRLDVDGDIRTRSRR